jgi:hypothetical protein
MNDKEILETTVVVPLKLIKQEGSRLCWAAVAVAITKYYDPERIISQKVLAIQVFGEKSHNHVYSPEQALKITGHLKVSFERPLTLNEIRMELEGGRPVAACMRYFIGWHLAIIYGISTLGELLIADPLHGYSTVPINEFTNTYLNDYSWSHSFLTQK